MEDLKAGAQYTAKYCFACSQNNPIGLKLKPAYDGEKVTAEFTPGKFHQGWNDVVHGGILYTLLDEVAAYAMLCQGIEFGVTAKSEIRFKQAVGTNKSIKACAWVTKLTKRLVEAKGVLTLGDGTVLAEGDFLFYVWRQSRRAILWDMDAVIADSAWLHFAAWQEAFHKRGIEFRKKDFIKVFGGRNDLIVRSVMGRELSERDVRIVVREKEDNFRRKAAGNLKPFPGVIELLQAIRRGNFKLGLVSSAPKENVDLVLDELNLGGIFDCVVFGQEVPEGKPSPQIYLLAAQRLGVVPNDCLVIEDSPMGVKAAKAAGMKCLAITNTHSPQELTDADRIVDSLTEVDLITLLTKV